MSMMLRRNRGCLPFVNNVNLRLLRRRRGLRAAHCEIHWVGFLLRALHALSIMLLAIGNCFEPRGAWADASGL